MGFLAPSIPSAPPPPPPPPPVPDVSQIKQDISSSEQLSRKPRGKTSNILSGSMGDTSATTGSKSLLGQ